MCFCLTVMGHESAAKTAKWCLLLPPWRFPLLPPCASHRLDSWLVCRDGAPFLGTKLSQGVRGGRPPTQKGGVVPSLHLSTSDGENYFWDLIPWTGASTIHNRDLKHWYLRGQAHTEDGDCSHEIQRHLLLGRKAMSNLDCVLKCRDITLPTKICLVKASFPSSHILMWELDHKEGWVLKNWCFWTVVLKKTL